MPWYRLIVIVLLAASMLPALAATEFEKGSAAHVRRFGFPGLDRQTSIRLRTTNLPPLIRFGRRLDESVTRAVLKVRYTYSPMLTPLQSHVRVLLNGEIAGILPVNRANAGKEVVQEVELDPRAISTFNKLALEFIGHYTDECEDPLHSAMWVDIARGTEVQMSTRPAAVKNDLALLPQPFFDTQDYGLFRLPYVFAAKPSHATLRAAGITSSWFGMLASWRGARFPAFLDTLPMGHAVVFATNAERPAFLKDMAAFSGPGLAIVTHPADGYSKLLLVSGRDGEDLRAAATSLALGNAALSGERVDVLRSHLTTPRKAYDAPNWVRVDRPMKFGELIDSPQQLQVFGHVPEPVSINLRIPPDLFTWRSRGVPVDLKFRYTPPVRSIDSHLSMSINGERVQTVNLRSSGQGGESTHVMLPLLDAGLLGEGRELLIPAFKLGARNELGYAFEFSYLTAGVCRDTQIENVRAMIDPDSTVNFSGYPHYAEMPHLGYFATAGFPFTKYADLAQTTVVMPQAPASHDIEVMLTLLGRMGESTGYPATRVTVAGPGDQAALNDRDLLLIGAAPDQGLLERWSAHLPAIISGPNQGIRPAEESSAFFGKMLDPGMRPAPGGKTQKHLRGDGRLAALLGFESPVTAGRSVVAVTAAAAADMEMLFDMLQDDESVKRLHGSVVLVHGGQTESLFAGRKYTLGSLPLWTMIWFPLSAHPVLLALLSVVAVLVFAFALWRSLRAVASRRLQGDD